MKDLNYLEEIDGDFVEEINEYSISFKNLNTFEDNSSKETINFSLDDASMRIF